MGRGCDWTIEDSMRLVPWLPIAYGIHIVQDQFELQMKALADGVDGAVIDCGGPSIFHSPHSVLAT